MRKFVKTTNYSLTSGEYDYLSIMHYDGQFSALKEQQGYKVGERIDNSDKKILSEKDLDAVKRMY